MRAGASLLLVAMSLCGQSPTPIKAPIRRVRLHPDEAWVTRIGHARLEAGNHRLVVASLPGSLGLDDLRVQLKGPEGSRMGDIAVSSDPRTVTETPEWKALERESEDFRGRRDALEAEGEALDREYDFLKSLQSSYDKELSSRLALNLPKGSEVVDLSRSLQQRMQDVLTRDRRTKIELEKLSEQESLLQTERHKRSAEIQKAPTRVSVEVSLASPGAVELELSYRNRQAQWFPQYEARLSQDRQRMELVLFAAVRQLSGEDWKDVGLEISNVRASRSLVLPVFRTPVELSWQEVQPQAHGSTLGVVSGISAMDNMSQNTMVQRPARPVPSPPPPPPPQEEARGATETEARTLETHKGLGVTFSLEGSKDVSSNGEPHRFRVLSQDLKPELKLVATPRLDPTVYQIARFPTPEGIPLFPNSPIVQFIANQRLGQAQLLVPRPGEPFELSFGPYRGLRAALIKVESMEESVGTFTKERQWTIQERIELANDTLEPHTLEIQDAAFLSRDEKVKVTAKADPAPTLSLKSECRGWSFPLAPKGQAQIQLQTIIRGPLTGTIEGLKLLRR